jgi:hypothetical protein
VLFRQFRTQYLSVVAKPKDDFASAYFCMAEIMEPVNKIVVPLYDRRESVFAAVLSLPEDDRRQSLYQAIVLRIFCKFPNWIRLYAADERHGHI